MRFYDVLDKREIEGLVEGLGEKLKLMRKVKWLIFKISCVYGNFIFF